jgi:hypothetical protein
MEYFAFEAPTQPASIGRSMLRRKEVGEDLPGVARFL